MMKAKVIQAIMARHSEPESAWAIERRIKLAFRKGYVIGFDAVGIKLSSAAALALYALWCRRAYKEAWALLGEIMGLDNHKE